MRYKVLVDGNKWFSWIGEEYGIDTEKEFQTIEDAVQYLLDRGWKLAGGISSMNSVHLQAMTYTSMNERDMSGGTCCCRED